MTDVADLVDGSVVGLFGQKKNEGNGGEGVGSGLSVLCSYCTNWGGGGVGSVMV
jgi:hypothetical protein